MLETSISNISRILENVADLVNQIVKHVAVRDKKDATKYFGALPDMF